MAAPLKGLAMGMGNRILALCIALSAALVLGGCGKSKADELQGEVDDLQAQIDQLQGQLQRVNDATDDVKEKAEAVTSASGELSGDVSRFGSEDWQQVVPDVTSATDQIDSAQAALSQSVSDLDDAAEGD